MEELAKHQEELIKDEAMGHEGGSDAHAHRIYIDGDYDEDRGISEKDCEEAGRKIVESILIEDEPCNFAPLFHEIVQ